MGDVREDVISKVVSAMFPLMDSIQLQMLEGAVRGALHGVKLEEECTEISFVSERIYNGSPRRLGKAAIEKITKNIVKRAGVGKIGTVHVFRRTFATRCVERGMAIEVVQELMGHSDPATTLKYYVAKAGLHIKAAWEKHVLCAA